MLLAHTLFHCIHIHYLFTYIISLYPHVPILQKEQCKDVKVPDQRQKLISKGAMVGDPGLPIQTYPLSISPAFLRPRDKITQHVRRLTLTLARLWSTKTQNHQQAEIFTSENYLPQFSAKPDKWFTTPREVRSALVINFWHLKSLFHYFEGSG